MKRTHGRKSALLAVEKCRLFVSLVSSYRKQFSSTPQRSSLAIKSSSWLGWAPNLPAICRKLMLSAPIYSTISMPVKDFLTVDFQIINSLRALYERERFSRPDLKLDSVVLERCTVET